MTSVPDGALYSAPHPGQGQVALSASIRSVDDDADPLSVIPELDIGDPCNGFPPAPESSHYSADLLREYLDAPCRTTPRSTRSPGAGPGGGRRPRPLSRAR